MQNNAKWYLSLSDEFNILSSFNNYFECFKQRNSVGKKKKKKKKRAWQYQLPFENHQSEIYIYSIYSQIVVGTWL